MGAWTDTEVELIIADYFSMLSDQSLGKPYNKAQHRKNLLSHLNNRSEGSIEFKHQNISAVLKNLGQPYIKGYLPRFNYQGILEEKVIHYLEQHKSIEIAFKAFADQEIISLPKISDFENLLVNAPASKVFNEPSNIGYNRNPIKINYLEREQKNTQLGALGEELIFQYEKWNLIRLGKEDLASQVIWTSKELGDGAGFDILSKYPNGSDKYIEVKTTKLGKETPFFFSKNELEFSKEHGEDYHLFRLFNFGTKAQFFVKRGGLDIICNSIPTMFKGFF